MFILNQLFQIFKIFHQNKLLRSIISLTEIPVVVFFVINMYPYDIRIVLEVSGFQHMKSQTHVETV